MKMEFLHPPNNDPGQVILLLIVFQKARARMVWFEWSSGVTLRASQMLPSRQVLPREESAPLLLIPFIKLSAFMIVSETRITVYNDILTGTPRQTIQSLRHLKGPEEPGLSRRLPIWTQWARPIRQKDAIYLCREDGIVQYLEFQNETNHTLDSTHQAGRLDTTVDTAFAVIDVGPNTVDLLVAGGSSSEGGLWRMLPREDPNLVDSIANWTPLHSLTTMSSSNEKGIVSHGPSMTSSHQHRLFACTGNGKHGAVSELRYGHRASETLANETKIIGDAMSGGVLGVWAFHGFFGNPKYQFEGPQSWNDRTYILIALPTQTSLLRVHLEPMLLDKHTRLHVDPQFIVGEVGLNLPTRTVFAGTTAEGLFVHIAETTIVIYRISGIDIKSEDSEDVDMLDYGSRTEEISIVSSFEFPDPDARILAASMHHEHEKSVVLLAIHRDGHFGLQLGHLDTEYVPKGEFLQIMSQPSCVHLQLIGDDLVAFVATLDHELHAYQADEQRLIPSRFGPYIFKGSFPVCDSLAIMTSADNKGGEPNCLVICGLRNGSIQTLHCTSNASSMRLTFCEEMNIGDTSVSAIIDVSRKGRVLLHSERHLCSLEYQQDNGFSAPAVVRNIWISDHKRHAPQQGKLSAFTQVVDSWVPRGVPGLAFANLVCIDGNKLHMAKLDDERQPQMVPRCLKTRGNPEKVVYSAYLKKLIVLCNGISVPPTRQASRNSNIFGTRVSQPLIRFLDPDNGGDVKRSSYDTDVKQEYSAGANDEILMSVRKPTESFLGITEWFPNIGGNEHHLLVINTKLTRKGKPAGRLLIFSIKTGAVEDIVLVSRKGIDLEAPVYSVAAYPDQKSIIYCSGSELYIHSLASTQNGIKWRTPAKATMRSPGRSLTINEPYIYVSSARESLAVYKYTDHEIVYQYGDQSARDGLHHVYIPHHSLILASDMTGTIVGLWQPPERRVDNAMPIVFEATLPASISCLQCVTRPKWCRDPANPQGDQAVIGSSEDGRMVQFDILSEDGWRLLRFVQNMAERNEVVCPFKGQGPYKRHIYPSTSKPPYMHINGDVLQRVLERGAEALIKEMLDTKPDLESHTDFDSAEDRWERFKELASEVVDTGNSDWLGKVVQWVRYLLRSAL